MIFVSYSSKDIKIALRICAALEAKGLVCWIAGRDINPGENFGDAIVSAIRAAKLMLLVFTENANNSDEIKKELVLAGHHRLTVIPVRVEDVVPGGAFAYELATRQWIDLFEDWDREIERLGEWIRRTLAVTPDTPPATAASGIAVDEQLARTMHPDRDVAPLAAPLAVDGLNRSGAAPSGMLSPPGPPIRDLPHAAVSLPESVPPESAPPTRRRALRIGGAAAGMAAIVGAIGVELQPGFHFWRLIYDTSVRTYDGHAGTVFSGRFSPDGRTLLSASDDATLALWDVTTGLRVRTFRGHGGRVTAGAFTPDGRAVVSGGADMTIRLWDLTTGEPLREFDGEMDYVWSLAVSPDGRTVLSGEGSATPRLWDIATGREIRAFKGHTGRIREVAVSPDGLGVLSGSQDQTVRLWIAATGRPVRTFTGHTDWVTAVAFSPDGRLVASGSHDRTVKLWDVATGQELRTLSGSSSIVLSVAFAPDGRTILAGGGDNLIGLWDVATGRRIGAWAGHAGTVVSLAVSPDGRFALSASADRTLKLWTMPG